MHLYLNLGTSSWPELRLSEIETESSHHTLMYQKFRPPEDSSAGSHQWAYLPAPCGDFNLCCNQVKTLSVTAQWDIGRRRKSSVYHAEVSHMRTYQENLLRGYFLPLLVLLLQNCQSNFCIGCKANENA